MDDHDVRRRTRILLPCLALLLLGPTLIHGAPVERLDRLTIFVPGNPDGGWGQTAQDLATALRAADLVERVDVVYSPGAGGTVGLAEFVHARAGDPTALLVAGLALVGSARANSATVSLIDTTPVARLFDEELVVVVPGESPFLRFRDLADAFRANPGATSWAAGHHGGADHLLVARLAGALGVAPTQVNFTPSPGGGEALRALLDNRVTAGVSGYAEVHPHVVSGKLRALAIAASQPSRRRGIPTLQEQGVPLAMSNWRGVFAAPGLAPEQRLRLSSVIEALAYHPSWRSTLVERGWTESYLAGDPFSRFLDSEHARIEIDPAITARSAPPVAGAAPLLVARRAFAYLVVVACLAGAVWATRRRRGTPVPSPAVVRTGADPGPLGASEGPGPHPGITEEIERQFETWSLSPAERDVGRLILKGLRHKEIARVRHTSERTVRHQALAIYRKAGLEGRTDLAAHFLEDLLYAPGPRSGAA